MTRQSKPEVAQVEYQELEIEVSRCLCDRWEVRILGSPFDRPRERFDPPFSLDELNQHLDELDSLQLATDPAAVSKRKSLAEEVGQSLYRALLPGKVHRTFSTSLAALRSVLASRDLRMRIKLSFGEAGRYLPEVVALPWELLCSPETLEFPSSAPETPLVRYLDLEWPIEPIAIEPPLRVLAVIASPRGLPEIDRELHQRILRDSCERKGRVELYFLRKPSLLELREKLGSLRAAGKPVHVIHFLGHGAFSDDGVGYLYFERADRGADEVSGSVVARTIAGFREVRLAVLSTCVGARMMRRRGQHPFAGVASALVAGGLPAVVGMQFTVSETAVSEFNRAFYRQMGRGRSLEDAVTEGRIRILTADARTFEWASPVLFLRSRDGRVLDLVEKETPSEIAEQVAHPSSGDRAGRDFYKAYVIQKIGRDSIQVGGDMNVGTPPRPR